MLALLLFGEHFGEQFIQTTPFSSYIPQGIYPSNIATDLINDTFKNTFVRA